jgi:tRNA G10  N-methylase Trm11
MNMNFFDFFDNWLIYKDKKYIRNLLTFYKNDESPKTIYKIYNLAINSIHAFRPATALQLFDRFKPAHVLDPCAGWGGRAVAAHVYGCRYTGYDCNTDLATAYNQMVARLGSRTQLHIGDALLIDYTKLKKYDCVMTSPPYYDLERYAHNKWFSSDDEMDDQFYFPLFSTLQAHLAPRGWIILSINEKLYRRVFSILYGPPHEVIPLLSYKRVAADYNEYIYAWQK